MNEKRVAVVTGSTGGIGLAICEKLLEDGCCVIGLSRTARSGLENNQNHIHYNVDISALDETALLMEGIIKQYGAIDLLVNNAGITDDASFRKMGSSQWAGVLSVNLVSLYATTHEIFKCMCEKRRGRIINISSVNAKKGQFGQANYCAAKAGIYGFTKSLALEGARYGVTVNSVSPGYTETSMISKISPEILESIKSSIPMMRFAKPQEIAGVVSFLASDAAAYITGADIPINGGLYMS